MPKFAKPITVGIVVAASLFFSTAIMIRYAEFVVGGSFFLAQKFANIPEIIPENIPGADSLPLEHLLIAVSLPFFLFLPWIFLPSFWIVSLSYLTKKEWRKALISSLLLPIFVYGFYLLLLEI